jgi:hypothetical protein
MIRLSCSAFFIAALLVPWQASAQCLAPDIVVFYGNGIRTTAADAELDREAFEAFLNRNLAAAGQPQCDTPVWRAPNQTNGLVADLLESAQQKLNASPTLFAQVLSWVVSNESIGKFLAEKIAGIDYQTYVSSHADDLAAHLNSYRNVLNSGGRIIVVAHSQGNLFANEAYLTLLQEYGTSLAQRMRIVAVATPASTVAGLPLVGAGPHTTLQEDFIHLVPGALGFNTAAFPAGSCGLPWDCHAFVGSYLDVTGAVARARILQKIREAFPPFPIAAGTYSVANVGVVGTAFLFDPIVNNGIVQSLTAIGPSGWNNNNPQTVFRYQPPGINTHRSLFFSGVQPVSGTYTLSGSVGFQQLSGKAVIDATSTLTAPHITTIEASATSVFFQWNAAGAQSLVVYLHDDPVDSTPIRQQVLGASAASHAFGGLSLTPGRSYRVEVFSLSQDVLSSGSLGAVFNISSSGAIRFTLADPVPPVSDATTYVVDRAVGNGRIRGTIQTTGKVGVLTRADIVNWNLEIDADGSGSFARLVGPTSGNNSALTLFSPALEATQNALVFDFSLQTANQVLQFATPDFQSVWQLQAGVPFSDELIRESLSPTLIQSFTVRPQKQIIATLSPP